MADRFYWGIYIKDFALHVDTQNDGLVVIYWDIAFL